MKRWLRAAALFAETIKISHTVFALPFAIAAAFMAADGPVPLLLAGKIVLACVFARTAAMSFNRFADAEIDRRNPRTQNRAVATGALSRSTVLAATIVSSLLFVAVARWIHELAFALSPIALAVVLGYSFTKRFTSFSHLVLGAALGLSPLGAWIAVRSELGLAPVLLGLAVLVWTAGFDIIYACQDRDFDVRAGLHSVPKRLGIGRALWLARGLHVATVLLLLATGLASGYGLAYFAGVAVVALLLFHEHRLVAPDDLSRVDVAFFTLNGLVSVFFMSAVIVEVVS